MRRGGERGRGGCWLWVALAAAGCIENTGAKLGKGLVSAATTPESIEGLGKLAGDLGTGLTCAAVEKLSSVDERKLLALVIHDATVELTRVLDERLRDELGPTIRDELRLAVQATTDRPLDAKSRAALAGLVRTVAGGAAEETVHRADAQLAPTPERASAQLEPVMDRAGADLQVVLERAVSPALEQLLYDDVVPGSRARSMRSRAPMLRARYDSGPLSRNGTAGRTDASPVSGACHA